MSVSKAYDYIVSGYYGFGNTGDDAVLTVLIKEIKLREDAAKIAVISEKKYPELERFGVHFICRRSIRKTLSALSRAKTLIFGGGSLMQDVTSCRSLIYYALILKAGRALCDRTVIFANGIGPLDKAGEKIAAGMLSSADAVSVRDPVSLGEAVRLGADPAAVTLSADPVFLMDTHPAGGRTLLSGAGVDGRFFAVSLRNFPECEKSVHEVVRFCKMMKNNGLFPVFFPMQDSADGELCRRAAKECGGAVIADISAEEILSVLALSEFSVGMRLHFLLFSLMTGKPTVALSYDPKIDSTVPYSGGECVLGAAAVTAEDIGDAVQRVRKNTGGEFLRRRCMEMRDRAGRDMDSLCRRSHTLVKTLYSKSV